MVTRKWIVTLLGIVAVAPVRADGILEQIQNEVAKITIQTRSAVVAVEDERKKITLQFFESASMPNESQRKSLEKLQEELKRYEVMLASQDKSVANALTLYEKKRTKEALSRLDMQTAERRSFQHMRDLHKQEVQNFNQLYRRQAVATLENSVMTEQINILAKKLTTEQRDLTELKRTLKNDHPRLVQRQKHVNILKMQLDAIRTQMAQVQSAPARRAQAFNVFRANSGTGFSIGDGYILTTADVVEPMENPTIITDKGTRIKAKIVGVNGELNIGLLKLLAQTNLPALTLGDSQPVLPGHFALSIGNQTGDPNSVALNLVGGRREQGTVAGNRFYPTLFQIAGTVGAGTSGAPLMNAKGEVIGIVVAIPLNEDFAFISDPPSQFFASPMPSLPPINTMRREPKGKGQNLNQMVQQYEQFAQDLARTRTFANRNNTFNTFNRNTALPVVSSTGYALPINEIKAVIEQLKTGQVTRGWIGIAPEDEEETVEDRGFLNVTRQVRITGVFPESPALQAGIQPGDVLLRINDKPVRNSADVRETSLRLRPGDTLTLRIIRFDKQPIQKDVELKILPRPMEPKPAITTPIITPSKKTNNP